MRQTRSIRPICGRRRYLSRFRSRSLELLVDYTETAVRVATRVTASAEQLEAAEKEQQLQPDPGLRRAAHRAARVDEAAPGGRRSAIMTPTRKGHPLAQLGERLVRNPGARRAGEDGNPASASGSAGWSRLCTSPPIAPRYVRILLGFGHWIARGAHCEWWQRRVPGRRAGASRILIAFASGRLDERRVRR